jgi:glutamine synthetase-like protein
LSGSSSKAPLPSCKRLIPGFEAPVLLAYSSRNRSASCRIPYIEPQRQAGRGALPDPAANPYLAFQGGEQRGRAVTLVIMAAPLDLTRPHRQQRLGAIDCLDLGLLINAEHEGVVGRVDVEADDVAHLVDKQRIRMGKRLGEIQPPDDEDAA